MASVKISWDGGDVAPVPRFPVSGETERKFKLLQVRPRNLSHCRGALQSFAPNLRPTCAQHSADTFNETVGIPIGRRWVRFPSPAP